MLIRKNTKRFTGFTLIELIMVVVLIGMMTAFVIPNYGKAVNKSYEKAGSNNLRIIYSAQQVKKNSGLDFQMGSNVTDINTALSLGILSGDGFNYQCCNAAGANCGGATDTTFKCTAARTDGSFTMQITDGNSNVCCAAGTCPSVVNVGTAPC